LASLTWRKFRAASLSAATLTLVGACHGHAALERPPEPGDQAVARVDSQTVWASDVKREAVAEGVIGPGDPLDVSSNSFRQVLDEVIDTRVLADAALARGLDKEPAGQRRLAAARDRALEDLMVDSVVGPAVNRQAEDALYQEFLKDRSPSEQIRLKEIVSSSEADAQGVRKALEGGADFDQLAMERSVDPATRFKGGDLGEATMDTLPPALASAVRDAKPGELVGPLRVDAGWALLKVEDRRPEPAPSLDAVRPQLIRFITYDRIKDLVLTLRSRAKIAMLLPEPTETPAAPVEPASAPPAGLASPPLSPVNTASSK
jgi:peptidyl-prolyl cis-trans isomerase C